VSGAEIRTGDRATATPVPCAADALPAARRMVVRLAGERMCPWRAVDREGEVLDSWSGADASGPAADVRT